MIARRDAVQRAKGLRRRMSLPEVLLWQALRRRAQGFRFRRQHPIGPFVVDFFCDDAKLVVEVEGCAHHHEATGAYDSRRETWLREQGVEVLRLPARTVLKDMEAALAAIIGAADERARSL